MNTTETVEKLKKLKDQVYFHCNPSYKMTLAEVRDGYNALESALTLIEAGEKDSERLDWLEKSAPNAEYYGAWQVQLGGYESNSGLVRAVLCDDHRHKTVRGALDAAMGGEAPYEGI